MMSKIKSVAAVVLAACMCWSAQAITAKAVQMEPGGYCNVQELLGEDVRGWTITNSLDTSIASLCTTNETSGLLIHAENLGQTQIVLAPSQAEMEKSNLRFVTVNVVKVDISKYLTDTTDYKVGSTATLNIKTHFNLPDAAPDTKVLFVGTGCTSHTLSKEKIIVALNAITDEADVDAYVFAPSQTVATAWNKSFKKGHAVTTSDLSDLSMAGNAHSCMRGFYDLFNRLASDASLRYKYHYIVMEFDGQRLAAYKYSNGSDGYEPDAAVERRVAVWLNEYYHGSADNPAARVVWVVDAPVDDNGITLYEDPEFFRPFQAHITRDGSYEGPSARNPLYGITDERMRGLLGLLNPWKCLKENEADDLWGATTAAVLSNRLDACCTYYPYNINEGTYTKRAGDRFIYQGVYTNADELAAFLAARIEPITYNALITDNIETQGLEIVSAKISGSTTGSNWRSLAASYEGVTGSVVTVDNVVTGVVEGITKDFWSLVQLDLKDVDGSFRANAALKEIGGQMKLVRDPNLNTNSIDVTIGEAAFVYFSEELNPEYYGVKQAETEKDWEFNPGQLTIEVVSVDRAYDGTASQLSVRVTNPDVSADDVDFFYCYNKGAATEVWNNAPNAPDAGGYIHVTNDSPISVYAALKAGVTPYFRDSEVTNGVYVRISPLKVKVGGISTNKVYAANDPTFSWKYVDDSAILEADKDAVFKAIDGSIGLTRNGAGTQEDANAEGQSYEGVIVASENLTAGRDYEVEYEPADFRITKKDITTAAATDYIGIYDAASNTIGLTVNETDREGRQMQVQFSLDNSDWSDKFVYGAHGAALTNAYGAVDCIEEMPVYVKVLGPKDHEGNYNPTNLAADVTITQRLVTVKANDASKAYGEEDPSFTWKLYEQATDVVASETDVVYAALTNVMDACGLVRKPDTEVVGEDYTITTNEPFAAQTERPLKNYRLEFLEGTFTLNLGTLAVTAAPAEMEYDGTTTNITLTVKDSNTEEVLTDCTIKFRDASDTQGEWKEEPAFFYQNVTNATVHYVVEHDGYAAVTNTADQNAWVKITPRTIYVDGVSTNKVYGARDPEPLPYTYDLANVVAGEEADIRALLDAQPGRFGRAAGDDVNETGYAITNEAPFFAGVNYLVKYRPATFTITKKDITTAVATDYIGLYDATSNTIGLTVGETDLEGRQMQVQFSLNNSDWSDKLSYGSHGTVLTNAFGAVDCIDEMPVYVKVLGPKDHEGNYNPTNLAADVTITQRLVTVKADDASKKFGESDPDEFTWKLYDQATDVVASETDAVYAALTNVMDSCGLVRTPDTEAIGTYDITTNAPFASQTERPLKNYRLEFLKGTFTIGIGTLNVVAAPAEMTYDGTTTNITLTVTDSKTQAAVTDCTIKFRDAADVEGEWKEEPAFFYQNVTNTTVHYIVEKEGYAVVTNTADANAWVKIHPRSVTVKAKSYSKTYGVSDDTLTPWGYDYDFSQVVAGDEASVSNYLNNSRGAFGREAGESVRLGGYAITNEAPFYAGVNYTVKYESGNLLIKKRPIIPTDDEDDEPSSTNALAFARGAVKIYDGVATGIVVGVKGILTEDLKDLTKTYSLTDPKVPMFMASSAWDTKSGTEIAASLNSFTNVKGDEESVTVWCRIAVNDNYEPCVVSNQVKILRRDLLLRSLNGARGAAKTCAFNEVPLTFDESEIYDVYTNVVTKGLVAGETLIYSNFATNETAGTTLDAKFSTAEGTARTNNYALVYDYGKLTVRKEPSGCEGICSWVDIGEADPDDIDVVYDFTMKLTTTSVKSGKGYTSTYKVYLGQDTDGVWWYDESNGVFNMDGNAGYYPGVKGDKDTKKVLTISKGVGKLSVSGLSDELKEQLMNDLAAYAYVECNGTEYDPDTYTGVPEIYKGKARWCANFSWKEKVPGRCYRVAGKQTFDVQYKLAECCGETQAGRFEEVNGLLPDLNTTILYRFGSIELNDAKSIEFVGYIGNGVAAPQTFASDILPTFALAGQGTLASVKDKKGVKADGISSMSGSLVGIWYDPECEVCCGNNGIAIVFACDGEDNLDDNESDNVHEYAIEDVLNGTTWYSSSGVQQLWGTAAYGTFTMKLNTKASNFTPKN